MTTPDDMVERVARAIYDAADPTSGDSVATALMDSPFVGDGGRDILSDIMDICRSAARAAIEAMREPTEAMVLAGCERDDGADRTNADGVYRAMINAALGVS